jgi:3-oxoacyl-[acyl-carrier protein] reductase
MKRVLITGAGGGLGSAFAAKLTADGWEVVAPSRNECDLSTIDGVNSYIGRNRFEFDALINNAGINDVREFSEFDPDYWAKILRVNLTSAMLLMKASLPFMRSNHSGKIVNITSIYSFRSRAGRSLYSATKAALRQITASVALEEGKHGILVNSISPGFILTPLTEKNNTPDRINELQETIPLGRLGRPEEVAELLSFFVSEKNTYMTGQDVVIDGGFSLQ